MANLDFLHQLTAFQWFEPSDLGLRYACCIEDLLLGFADLSGRTLFVLDASEGDIYAADTILWVDVDESRRRLTFQDDSSQLWVALREELCL